MNTSQISPDDELANFASDSSGVAATLDTDDVSEAAPAAKTGPCCEKCGTQFRSDLVSVCSRCGWYASLKQFVDVDQNWETYNDDHEQPAETTRPSHLEVWLGLMPRWGWILVATLTAVVLESVVVRLVTPDRSMLRTGWSLAQLGIGLMAFAGCHVFNFLTAAADDADFGALDLLLRPVKLWLWAFHRMPERQWVTDAAAAGLMGVVMSFVVIGGLPYERLWDWGFEKPTNQNLMGAVMSRMNEVEGDGADNLEDAVADFAGSQNLEPGSGEPPAPLKPREKTDCIILGYRLDAQDRLASLILGTAYRNALVYAGSVTPKLTDEEETELLEALISAKTDQPFLTVQTTAVWVEPKFTCRVSYVKRLESGRLQNLQFEELLGGIRLE